MVRPSEVDGVDERSPCDDQVKLMPVLGAWVTPGYFVLGFGLEKGVGHTQVIVGAQFKKALSIVIGLSDTEVTKAGRPGLMVRAHSRIEITQKKEMFITWDTLDYSFKVVIEFILGFRSGGQGWSINTDEGGWAIAGVKAKCQKAF